MRRINLLGYPSPRVLGLHGRISTLGHLSGGDDYGDGNTRRPTRQVASGCGPRPLLLVSGARRGLVTASSSGGSAGPNKQQQQRQGESAAPAAAAAVPALKTESITWEDEGPSLRPEDYAFDDEDDGEEMWERLAGAADDDGSGSHARVRGYSRTKERLAKKFPIEMADLDPDEDEEDEESVPGLGLGGGRRPSQAQQQQQGQELEEEQEEFTPRERRQRDKEEEKDKKWAQIIAPLKFDLDAQIAAGKHIPLWYPHIEEYEGDGYDDYARTLQGTWEDDSPFHRDYEYDEKEFKNHFTWSTDGNQHILNVGRHTKTTKAGRVFSFSATMIDGNGNGRAGWGYGKGPTLSDAVVAAQKDCERNSFFIDRYKGSCLSESIRFSYKKCSVEVFALPEGRLHPTSSQVMQLVFNAFGLQYVAGKWLGSKNKTKRIKTLFMALRQIEHPDYTSEKLGMKLFKPRKIPRKHGRVWSYD